MEQLVLHKRFASWNYYRLEHLLDTQSQEGYTLISTSLKKQIFETGGVPSRHRLGYCAYGPQSAPYITYVSKQENAGWELVCQDHGWLCFRKPQSQVEQDGKDRLVDDRAPISDLFDSVIKRLEAWRRWELILTAILIIAGYATTNWVMRLAVIPLLLVLINTYLIKYMQESFSKDVL